MKEIEKLYTEAITEYRKAKYNEAEVLFGNIIKKDEKHSDAYANIAVIAKMKKDYKKAFVYLDKAIQISPKNANYHCNMGNLFRDTNNIKKSIIAYQNAIKLNPRDPNNYNNLGIAFEKAGDNNNAIAAYKHAVKVDEKYSKAINNIGVILYKQKKYEEAEGIFEIALKADPNYREVHSNRGACLNKLKRYDEAIAELDKAIEYNPKNGGAYTNLGNVYYKLDDFKKAIKLHQKSIDLEPNGSNAHSNLANAHKQLGYTDKAITSYKKALELDPNFVNAHFDLATTYLIKQDYENGWKEYEWRFKKEEMTGHLVKYKEIFKKPLFTGEEDIKGKTLLIHSEQGFGDSIQFVRFALILKEKYSCKVILSSRKELVTLFKDLDGLEKVVSREEDDLPEFDYQVSLLSLPLVLQMRKTKDIPLKTPYLYAPKKSDIKIQKEKAKIDIGICWSASVTGESYEGKVFDLEYLRPLIQSKKVNVYSLQVGPEKEDIKNLGLENDIIDITEKLTDFSQTAALIEQLDFVISSDTSVAHLAGAMNKKVYIPLQKMPDWRWLKKGENSIWYSNAKLYRQKTAKVWDSVFQSLIAKLSKEYKLKIK
jgi:tetratricopeptide (TPR) repeat protein